MVLVNAGPCCFNLLNRHLGERQVVWPQGARVTLDELLPRHRSRIRDVEHFSRGLWMLRTEQHRFNEVVDIHALADTRPTVYENHASSANGGDGVLRPETAEWSIDNRGAQNGD
jgi:hypothetical protein